MRKAKPKQIRVNGLPDSLTDHLKHLLYAKPGQGLAELVPQIRRRLATRQTAAGVEKHVRRCLENNPAFVVSEKGFWSVDLGGNRDNDVVYQWLKGLGKALNMPEIHELAVQNEIEPDEITERDLARDGRFIRLKKGRWALVNWELIYKVTAAEMAKVDQLVEEAGAPLELEYLAQAAFKTVPELTDLEKKLKQNKGLAYVGGGMWCAARLVPDFKAIQAQVPDDFKKYQEAETAALQEAELMLILANGQEGVKECILSSLDLKRGTLTLSKRLEKLCASFNSPGYVLCRHEDRTIPLWYSREYQLLVGLSDWYRESGLLPGAKLRLAVDGKPQTLLLEAAAEREAQVHAQGQRILELRRLKDASDAGQIEPAEMAAAILKLFPDGLNSSELGELFREITGAEPQELLNYLQETPYFEETEPGLWRLNQKVYLVYDQVQQELRQARIEAAAAGEEARRLVLDKDSLEEELSYLQTHHREEETIFQQRIAELNQDVNSLSRENEQLRGELEKFHRRQDQLRHQTASAEERAARLKEELEVTKDKLKMSEARVIQTQGYLSRTIEEFNQEEAQLKRRISDLENQLQGALMANDELCQNLERLQAEKKRLKKALVRWPVRLMVALTGGYRQ